ncbi:hypothetical protein I3760_06G167000 [Carya illinoinensis]|nr:hypothetical protein I3760_06G167000 [Carya illinoinensis]
MIVVGGQVGKLPAGPIASTGLESSSSPKLRFVFATVPNGGSTVGSQSRGSLRVKAVEGSMTVSGSGKVDDLYDESRNGHAANSVGPPSFVYSDFRIGERGNSQPVIYHCEFEKH